MDENEFPTVRSINDENNSDDNTLVNLKRIDYTRLVQKVADLKELHDDALSFIKQNFSAVKASKHESQSLLNQHGFYSSNQQMAKLPQTFVDQTLQFEVKADRFKARIERLECEKQLLQSDFEQQQLKSEQHLKSISELECTVARLHDAIENYSLEKKELLLKSSNAQAGLDICLNKQKQLNAELDNVKLDKKMLQEAVSKADETCRTIETKAKLVEESAKKALEYINSKRLHSDDLKHAESMKIDLEKKLVNMSQDIAATRCQTKAKEDIVTALRLHIQELEEKVKRLEQEAHHRELVLKKTSVSLARERVAKQELIERSLQSLPIDSTSKPQTQTQSKSENDDLVRRLSQRTVISKVKAQSVEPAAETVGAPIPSSSAEQPLSDKQASLKSTSTTKPVAPAKQSTTKPVAPAKQSTTKPVAAAKQSTTKPVAAAKQSTTKPVAAAKQSTTKPVAPAKQSTTKPVAAAKQSTTKPVAAAKQSTTKPLAPAKQSTTKPVAAAKQSTTKSEVKLATPMAVAMSADQPIIASSERSVVVENRKGGPTAQQRIAVLNRFRKQRQEKQSTQALSMSIKEMKQFLRDKGVDCTDVVEKAELVKRVASHLHN